MSLSAHAESTKNLVWTSTHTEKMSYQKAKIYCHRLDLQGLNWRLPSLEEFRNEEDIAEAGKTYITSTLYPGFVVDWTDDALLVTFSRDAEFYAPTTPRFEKHSLICVAEIN